MPPNAPEIVPIPKRPPAAADTGLTQAKVKAALPRARLYYIRDAQVSGLNLRVTPNGAKAYMLRSRIGRGRGAARIDLKIGTPSDMSLSQARDEAMRLLSDLRKGIDPRAPKAGAAVVADLLDSYETHLAQRQLVKRQDAMSTLRRNLRPYRRTPIGDLTRLMLVTIIEEIEAKGKPGAAQGFREKVGTFLNYCVDRGHLHASPMAGYRKPRKTRAERLGQPRLTYTGPEALTALWKALGAARDPIFRDLLRFALLTGQRRGEIAQMQWSDVEIYDEEIGVWHLPASTRKTGDAMSVPLGPLSVALLMAQPRQAGETLVFPSRKTRRPISGWGQRLDTVRSALGEPNFGLHALRRSYRSGLSDLGIDADTAELMIGHKRPGLIGVYDKSSVWDLRIAAQRCWESHLSEISKQAEGRPVIAPPTPKQALASERPIP